MKMRICLGFITLLLICQKVPAVVTTVYNANGFESHTVGSIQGQDGGKWAIDAGQPSDAAIILDSGGSYGKVLSFKPGGSYNIRLLLAYEGNPNNDPQLGSKIKWSFDFFQSGTVYGMISSSRNADVAQVKLLPQSGNLNVELRKNSPSAPYWPSTQIATYGLGQWHHIEIYQVQPYSPNESVLPVRIYMDGVELTKNNIWYTIWSGWVGFIGELHFNPNVQTGGIYYIDNLLVEEGPEIDFPITTPQIFTVFDSNGFENYTVGTVDGQDSGKWIIDYSSPLNAAEIVILPNTGVHVGRNKVLSFNSTGAADITALVLQHTGAFQIFTGSIVKWSFDFYQENSCYGAVYSLRNAGQVQQVKILPEIGNFNVELRRNSTEAPFWPSQKIGSYSILPDQAQWHHVEIYQFQPYSTSEVVGPVRIWMDGQELTFGSTWYTGWPYWIGYIDTIVFLTQVHSGSKYYIDNLKVQEGPDIPLPVEMCGAWGYLAADLNKDCKVDSLDLSLFVQDWLETTDIDNPLGKDVR